MSQKPRTSTEIQQEYNNLAFKAGNLQFELSERNKGLAMINQTLYDLSDEFVKAKAAENKAVEDAKAAAAVPQPDSPPVETATPAETAPEGAAS